MNVNEAHGLNLSNEAPGQPEKEQLHPRKECNVDHATTLVQVDSIWLNQFYDAVLLSSRISLIPSNIYAGSLFQSLQPFSFLKSLMV